MEKFYIDINCDVGEGIGNEEGILPLISSCNIACGGHTGDKGTMTQTVMLAKKYGVRIGAHPSYPDRKNFGRTTLTIDDDSLKASIQDQIKGLKLILDHAEVPLHHIKAHGALYNDLARNPALSELFLATVTPYKKSVYLYVPPDSVMAEKAMEKGFTIKFEAFADRNYNDDLSLVSRKLPNAVIREPQEVLDHLVGMVKKGKVKSVGGSECTIQADTYCLHGDTPNALRILTYLSQELPKQQIYIKK